MRPGTLERSNSMAISAFIVTVPGDIHAGDGGGRLQGRPPWLNKYTRMNKEKAK
jgi:hypothetical protein